MKVSVIVVAAGEGKRMGAEKQFVELGGIPLCIRACVAFDGINNIGEIILVVSPKNVSMAKEHVSGHKLKKVKKIVPGGDVRQASVYNGLKELAADSEYVLIHDGARPLLSPELVEKMLSELVGKDAVVLAVPVSDTVKQIDERCVVSKTVERKDLWAAQTPQGFRVSLIREAHEKAIKEGISATDDAVLVERTGKDVNILMGSYENMKITTPLDLVVAECIINKRIKEGKR